MKEHVLVPLGMVDLLDRCSHLRVPVVEPFCYGSGVGVEQEVPDDIDGFDVEAINERAGAAGPRSTIVDIDSDNDA